MTTLEKVGAEAVKEWLAGAYVEIDLDGNLLIEGGLAPEIQRKLKLKAAISALADSTDGTVDIDMEISKLVKVEKMLLACAVKIKIARKELEDDRSNLNTEH